MDETPHQRTQTYIVARQQHPAWQLLASRRAPLVLSCLQTLFEHSNDGIDMDDALQALAGILAEHANHTDFDIEPERVAVQARQELRDWIKRDLVVEREGRLYATDPLEEALRFVEALGGRMMTSTASRLSVVQREIENLEAGLNPDPASRTVHIRRKIAELEHEMAAVQAGDIHVLDEAAAIEGIREVYSLATSLRADFRRVEDSWREADRQLRQSIISEQHHRGEIVDHLLNGHEKLLDTTEGRVFESFQQQLLQAVQLDMMKQRLRTILRHPSVAKALNRQQQAELRWLVMRLVKESEGVFRARARSERDVKGFLKTGLAADHHRVGHLLSEILQQALHVDWQRQAVRRSESPLPPVAIAISGLPLIERLRIKSIDSEGDRELALSTQSTDLNQIEDDFWQAFDGLDREALIRETLALLAAEGRPLTVAELAQYLPPTHDLETLSLWLSMAREAGIPIPDQWEEVHIVDDAARRWRFRVPRVGLDGEVLQHINWEV